MNIFGITFNEETKKIAEKEMSVKSGSKLYFYTKRKSKSCSSKKSKKS